MKQKIELVLDSSETEKILNELDSETLQLVRDLLDTGEKLFSFKSRLDSASGANQLFVTLEPSDRLLDLAPAVSARNLDTLIVE